MRRRYLEMMRRCYDPRHKSYYNYGGRGIVVCERWRNSYEDYLHDVGLKPEPGMTLDRRDNDGNYEPSNIRWATASQQRCNQRVPTKNESWTDVLNRWLQSVP